MTAREQVAFAGALVFTAGGLYVLWLSFVRFEFDENSIKRTGLLTKPFIANFSELQSIKPGHQSFVSGVVLEFSDNRRVFIRARMTGYRQLLELLAKRDEDLQSFLSEYSHEIQKML